MSKETLNIYDHDFKESSDSCPRCGNPLTINSEEKIKECTAEAFDVATNAIIPCGFTKLI